MLESFLAEALSLEQMGSRVGKHPTTVAYWLKKHGLTAAHHDRFAPKGGLAEDLLRALVFEGLTIEQIAARCKVNVSTARRWMGKFELQTERSAVRSQAPPDQATGESSEPRRCSRHGETDFFVDSHGAHRCLRCRRERVLEHRRRRKETLVREAGGCCRLCGYDRCMRALQFHHLDPRQKTFGLGQRGIARSLERARDEAAKCVLLCANCHAEVEARLIDLPLQLAP